MNYETAWPPWHRPSCRIWFQQQYSPVLDNLNGTSQLTDRSIIKNHVTQPIIGSRPIFNAPNPINFAGNKYIQNLGLNNGGITLPSTIYYVGAFPDFNARGMLDSANGIGNRWLYFNFPPNLIYFFSGIMLNGPAPAIITSLHIGCINFGNNGAIYINNMLNPILAGNTGNITPLQTLDLGQVFGVNPFNGSLRTFGIFEEQDNLNMRIHMREYLTKYLY